MLDSKLWIETLAAGVELAAAAVVGLAAVQALARALPLFLRSRSPQELKSEVRLALGGWLALALEFALAADVLRTAVAPSWRDIGQLAAIAALRTALNFFLEREIRQEGPRAADRPRQEAGLAETFRNASGHGQVAAMQYEHRG